MTDDPDTDREKPVEQDGPEETPALTAAHAAESGLETPADPELRIPELQIPELQIPELQINDSQQLLPGTEPVPSEPAVERTDSELRAILEAIIYITDEPLTIDQMSAALLESRDRIQSLLTQLTDEFARPDHGLAIQEVAGGYKMATKPEHHESVRTFVRNLKPALKLSLPALETLAVIAYKQPITAPEVMEVRGVQGAGVLKTLLDRKLIVAAGRKNVIGKPILYKTTREFLVQFGLKDLSELPSLKEFEELGRMAIADDVEAPTADTGESEMAPVSPTGEEAQH